MFQYNDAQFKMMLAQWLAPRTNHRIVLGSNLGMDSLLLFLKFRISFLLRLSVL